MHRNNFLFAFIFLLSFVGCRRSEDTLISKWKPQKPKLDFERKLASLTRQQCVKDLYSTETLRAQVLALEEIYSSAPTVSGRWKHLDLSHLPVPQANFLLKYGLVLGDRAQPDRFNFSGCQDVPCVFNRIYKKNDDHPNGYVHYLWFLRFGNLLAADNMIPRQSSPNPGEYQRDIPPEKMSNPGDLSQYPYRKFSFEKYLFSDNELFGFWRLTMMLEGPFERLKFLSEIQRIPSTAWQEGNIPNHCGVASKSGYIVLMDKCLKEPETERGNFYVKVSHEMTHHIDVTLGSEYRPASHYYSTTNEYLAVADIKKVEYVDQQEKTQIKYEALPDAKYVTEYARTSPAETFAEMMAYFRFSGENTLKATTEKHYKFVSQKFFNEEDFSNAGYWKKWGAKYRPFVSQNVIDLINTCETQTTAETMGSDYLSGVDLPSGLKAEFVSCLSLRANELSKHLYGKVLSAEPEGCVLMNWNVNKVAWQAKIKEMIVSSITSSLSGLKQDPSYLQKLGRLFEDSIKTKVRESYLQCSTEASNSKECFRQKLNQLAEQRSTDLGFPPEQRSLVQDLYFSYFSYETQVSEVARFYRVLVESHTAELKKHASELWSACLAQPADDEVPPTGRYFKIQQGYMVSSLYNCLNVGFRESASDILGEIRYEGQPLTSSLETKVLSKDIDRLLNQELNSLFEKARAAEKARAQELMNSYNGKEESLLGDSLGDFSWVRVGKTQEQCQQRILSTLKFDAYFDLKKDLFKPLLLKMSCAGVTGLQTFKDWADRNRVALTSEVYSYLEAKLIEKGASLVQTCKEGVKNRSLLDGIFGKSQLNKCIDEGWIVLEDEVAHATSRVDVAFRLKISYESLLAEAQRKRSTLKKKVKDER